MAMVKAAHLELNVRDLDAARTFYVDQMGLPIVQDSPSMRLLAVQAGNVRLSIFGIREDVADVQPLRIILAVDGLDEAIATLRQGGVRIDGDPVTAGDFLRFVDIRDPDGNVLSLGHCQTNQNLVQRRR